MTPAGKYTVVGALLAGMAGIGLAAWRLLGGPDRVIKEIVPDALPMAPALGKTGYKRIDAILPQLRASSQSSGIPLGLMVGWIAKESGGKLSDTTSLDERGLYQLMPAESKTIGVDHQRLSTDLQYSIDAGVLLIRHYQSAVNDLNLPNAPAGNSYYWRLVKLGHSMGGGQLKKVVAAAKTAGQAGSWDSLESFATDMHINGPQPKKWMPFVDSVYKLGLPFGFGSDPPANVGFMASFIGSDFDFLGAEDA